ncbi:hypothetical protein SAICODRAFT_221833 [Saitoella complicata NRRL Y-17804]|nr:uncharacterized protein SAICODRAFT_221833 [Saitoella complicata NRRL Y-17804]ODQ53594.1 hypothetical protein SAICODRAFT_221833 [Saitoella complicata NRRL Y-17804]
MSGLTLIEALNCLTVENPTTLSLASHAAVPSSIDFDTEPEYDELDLLVTDSDDLISIDTKFERICSIISSGLSLAAALGEVNPEDEPKMRAFRLVQMGREERATWRKWEEGGRLPAFNRETCKVAYYKGRKQPPLKVLEMEAEALTRLYGASPPLSIEHALFFRHNKPHRHNFPLVHLMAKIITAEKDLGFPMVESEDWRVRTEIKITRRLNSMILQQLEYIEYSVRGIRSSELVGAQRAIGPRSRRLNTLRSLTGLDLTDPNQGLETLTDHIVGEIEHRRRSVNQYLSERVRILMSTEKSRTADNVHQVTEAAAILDGLPAAKVAEHRMHETAEMLVMMKDKEGRDNAVDEATAVGVLEQVLKVNVRKEVDEDMLGELLAKCKIEAPETKEGEFFTTKKDEKYDLDLLFKAARSREDHHEDESDDDDDDDSGVDDSKPITPKRTRQTMEDQNLQEKFKKVRISASS